MQHPVKVEMNAVNEWHEQANPDERNNEFAV
jgi:hypothetical protein